MADQLQSTVFPDIIYIGTRFDIRDFSLKMYADTGRIEDFFVTNTSLSTPDGTL